MSYPLPLTRTEAYLAYKAGVIQQSDLKPSLAVPRIGIDAWLAYWTELAADYPKNPDGTPMILQEEEAYIAYLCGVLDTYPEKCLRRVGAYLRYIISARWGRPDHPLNREELYLSLIKTQFIPSGDPSSDITIDGTAKAAFVDVKMYGDTLQKAYTGSNFYMAKPYSNATQQGIKTTIKDGYIFECSGTATTTYANIADWANVSLPAGTYTFCIDHTLTHKITMRLSFDPDTQDVVINSGNTSETVTVSSPIVAMRPFIATGGSGNVINDTVKLNIVAGSTPATVFEPYVGGISSPNPDYPQPIQAVTGLQMVDVRGKNLFDIDNYSSAVLRGGGSAVSVAKEGSTTLKLTNLISQGANFCGIPIPNSDNLLGKSVTISGTVELGTGVSDARVAVYAGTSSSVGTAVASRNITASGSFSLNANIPASYPSGANIIHFVIYGSGNNSPTVNSTVVYSNLQMEIGSATAYAPYSKHTYDINLGKNLLKFGFAGDSIDNITVSYDDSEVVLNGTKTGQGNIHNTSNTLTTLQAGTYTISSRRLSGSADNDRIRLIVMAGSSIAFTTRTNISSTASSYTFTLDSEQPVSFQIWSDGTCNCDNLKIGFMIEAGSQATAYAPYFIPIELCKLGSYQDYIWKDNGDWKVHKATATYTFDNRLLSWQRNTQISGGYVMSYNVNSPLYGVLATGTPSYSSKCTHFTIRNDSTTWTGVGKAGFNSVGAFWCMTNIADTNDFLAWLGEDSPELLYPLATPTDTIITNQALIDQLEALVNGGAEDGTTYIKVSATDPNLPGLLYVEAPKYE